MTAVPLIAEPERIPLGVLRELRESLRADLEETLEMVAAPRGAVRDPASLETAAELARSVLHLLDRPGDRDARGLAAEANLAYAAMLAVIDLVKSHTDVPRVPRPRAAPSP